MKKIIQFSYRYSGNPGPVPIVDCRVIPNPWRKGDKATDDERMDKVRTDPKFDGLVLDGVRLLRDNDQIAVGCVFGRHRSGAVAQEIAKRTGAIVEKLT